eukprot:g75715.t1
MVLLLLVVLVSVLVVLGIRNVKLAILFLVLLVFLVLGSVYSTIVVFILIDTLPYGNLCVVAAGEKRTRNVRTPPKLPDESPNIAQKKKGRTSSEAEQPSQDFQITRKSSRPKARLDYAGMDGNSEENETSKEEWTGSQGHGDNSESSESEGEVPEQKQRRRPVRVEEYMSDATAQIKRCHSGQNPQKIMRIVGMHPASNISRKVISGKETYQLVEDDFVHDHSAENNIMSQRGLPADMNFESVLESKNYMQGHNTVQVGSAATGMTQPAEPRPSKHRAAMSASGNLAKNANLTRRKRIKASVLLKLPSLCHVPVLLKGGLERHRSMHASDDKGLPAEATPATPAASAVKKRRNQDRHIILFCDDQRFMNFFIISVPGTRIMHASENKGPPLEAAPAAAAAAPAPAEEPVEPLKPEEAVKSFATRSNALLPVSADVNWTLIGKHLDDQRQARSRASIYEALVEIDMQNHPTRKRKREENEKCVAIKITESLDAMTLADVEALQKLDDQQHDAG